MRQCEEVLECFVQDDVISEAQRMKAFCEADLKLGPIQVRWFNEYHAGMPGKGRLFGNLGEKTFSTDTEGNSFISPLAAGIKEIWLNFELEDSVTVAQTVAHEARHLYQEINQHLLKQRGIEADHEQDAVIYSQEALGAYQYYPQHSAYALSRTNKIIRLKK